MKHLVLLPALLLLGCPETGSESPKASTSAIKAPDSTQPIVEPVAPSPAPAPVVVAPVAWSAPTTVAEAELEFRGNYTEQGKPSNTISIDGSRVQLGSVYTTYSYYLNGTYIERPVTCSWQGNNIRAETRADLRFNFYMQLWPYTHNAETTVVDCMKGPTQTGITEVAQQVRFISATCVGIDLNTSTAEKVYCK